MIDTLHTPPTETQSRAYLEQRSIFLFDEHSVKRLALARMNLDMTQADLAREISKINGDPAGRILSQNMLSRLEKGRVFYNPHVTVYALQVSLGKAWRYVVYGATPQFYDETRIRTRYWQDKFKKMGTKPSKKPWNK